MMTLGRKTTKQSKISKMTSEIFYGVTYFRDTE